MSKPLLSLWVIGAALLIRRAIGVSIPAGFTKILFEDDFSQQVAGSQPSPSKWSVSTGTSYPGGPAHWGTQEVQVYTSDVENLVITPSGTLLIMPQRHGNGWTSSRIETTAANDVACSAGSKLRIEASLKLGSAPHSQSMGIWPAFWSLGSGYRGNYDRWPAAGEIDIMESANGAPVSYYTLHCDVAPNGLCNEFSGLGGKMNMTRGVFHTIAVEIDRTNGGNWRGERLTWYIDDKRIRSMSGANVPNEAVWTAITRSPKFLLLNVAVGGQFPDSAENPGASHTPTSETAGGEGASLEVQYVAVFSS